MEFCNFLDKQSKVVKIIFALPFLDIIWSVYKLIKSLEKNDTIGIVVGIILLLLGPSILWIVDIITIALYDKVIWFD